LPPNEPYKEEMPTLHLITSADPYTATDDELRLPGLDPTFLLDGWRGLGILPKSAPERLATHFSHQVARSPTDLQCHTRRVLFAIQRQDSEGVFGALLDLYIALGDKGRALRQRLTEKARPWLSSEHYGLLIQSLDTGIHRFDALPTTQYAVLPLFLQGSTHLVTEASRTSTEPQPRQSLLDEVRDMIDYGQFKEAQTLLEESIIENPLQREIVRELLDIYKHTRNKEAFAHMRERLGGRITAVPGEWDQLASYFERLDTA
jgi:hypothetical protein